MPVTLHGGSGGSTSIVVVAKAYERSAVVAMAM